jgi:DNA repair and recombination RAD54-like protein
LRRGNTLNAEHLPPKLVQVVCCNLTEIQPNTYQHLISSKDNQHVLDGKQVNCLASIQLLMKLSNHPSLVAEDDRVYEKPDSVGRQTSAKNIKYSDDPEKETAEVPGANGTSKFMPLSSGSGGRGNCAPVRPEWSGTMFCVIPSHERNAKPGNGNDKIVVISNYTQTLDLIGRMC